MLQVAILELWLLGQVLGWRPKHASASPKSPANTFLTKPPHVAELTKFLRDQSTIAAYQVIRREKHERGMFIYAFFTLACDASNPNHPVKGLLTG
jgi:hypothetical protein